MIFYANATQTNMTLNTCFPLKLVIQYHESDLSLQFKSQKFEVTEMTV